MDVDLAAEVLPSVIATPSAWRNMPSSRSSSRYMMLDSLLHARHDPAVLRAILPHPVIVRHLLAKSFEMQRIAANVCMLLTCSSCQEMRPRCSWTHNSEAPSSSHRSVCRVFTSAGHGQRKSNRTLNPKHPQTLNR